VKLGTESRNKLIAAAVLTPLAVGLIGRALFSSGPTPTPTPVAAVTPVAGARPALPVRGRLRTAKAPHSIDPTLRYDWLKTSEDTKYEGNGRNIFLAQAEAPVQLAAAAAQNKKPEGPPLPPPPPPINLKFYGFASRAGEPKKVFLSQGEDVFIAGEGEVVDRRYKVLHISPMSVEIEDMLTNNRQSIPLTSG